MPYIPNAICCKCNLEMRCVKNGVDLEMLQDGGKPFYKVQADRYQCERCGQTVLIRFASNPFAHHFEEDYKLYGVELHAEFA